MNQKELKELIEFLIEKDIAEFELERGDVKVRIKRAGTDAHPAMSILPAGTVAAPAPQPVPAAPRPAGAPASSAPPAAPAETEEAGVHLVRSPIVGTFYESPSPGAPAFVKPGDTVTVGQVLCIIEAMKLMNEIESDFAGEIVKRFVGNGQPVEYGQPLFSVREA
jgi:acetyl-CoA carboxylase biotin carboxyl carrier protein